MAYIIKTVANPTASTTAKKLDLTQTRPLKTFSTITPKNSMTIIAFTRITTMKKEQYLALIKMKNIKRRKNKKVNKKKITNFKMWT